MKAKLIDLDAYYMPDGIFTSVVVFKAIVNAITPNRIGVLKVNLSVLMNKSMVQFSGCGPGNQWCHKTRERDPPLPLSH